MQAPTSGETLLSSCLLFEDGNTLLFGYFGMYLTHVYDLNSLYGAGRRNFQRRVSYLCIDSSHKRSHINVLSENVSKLKITNNNSATRQ